MFKLTSIAFISHASKVMIKIFEARLQQYVNQELPGVQVGSWRGRWTRDQIVNSCWMTEKAREFQKNIYFCFIGYAKAFACVTQNKLWKILKYLGTPDHLTYLLKNLCEGQEAIVRTRQETTDWFKIGKGVHQGCILSPCLFNLYVEHITWNAKLDESQTGIKIAGRNINNLRYADDTILTDECEGELKNVLMRVNEQSEEAGLKLNVQKTKIMASSLITSWQIEGRKLEFVTGFLFLGSKITADCDCSHEIKRCLLLGRKAMTMTNRGSVLKGRDITLPTKVCNVRAVFSSSHLWMLELVHEEGWALKNFFQIVMLEKTLKSPLYYKQIKPVNLKWSQLWIFIGRTDVAAEASIRWPPDV